MCLPNMCEALSSIPSTHQALCCAHITPTLERQKQEDQKFMVMVGYRAICLQLVPVLAVVLGAFRGIVHIYQTQSEPLHITQSIRPSL